MCKFISEQAAWRVFSENDTSGPTRVFCARIFASLTTFARRYSWRDIKCGPLFRLLSSTQILQLLLTLSSWIHRVLMSVDSRRHGIVSVSGQAFDWWLASIFSTLTLALAPAWFEHVWNSIDTIIRQDCRSMLLEAFFGEPADLTLNIERHPRVNPILLILLALFQLRDELVLHSACGLRVVDLAGDERIWDRSGGEKLKYPMHTSNVQC